MENRKEEIEKGKQEFPLVSIVVATKNEEKNIANCLESVKNSINSTNSINLINPINSMNSINPINQGN